MKYKVTFENVGRYQLGWSVELPNIEPATIAKAVKARRGAIASKIIVVDEGQLFVGDRAVGNYRAEIVEK